MTSHLFFEMRNERVMENILGTYTYRERDGYLFRRRVGRSLKPCREEMRAFRPFFCVWYQVYPAHLNVAYRLKIWQKT